MEFALPNTWTLGGSSQHFIDTTEHVKGARVFIPRKYYTTFISKIYTWPYIMFQIQVHESNEVNGYRQIIVCLSGTHQEDSNIIIVPDWILGYLGVIENSTCSIKFLTAIPEPVSHIKCLVDMTKQFYEELGFDIRTVVENELSDLQILTSGMPFEINLPEFDAQILCKIHQLRSEDWEVPCGYVEPNSDVSVEFKFIVQDAPVPAPVPAQVPAQVPAPVPAPAPAQQLSSEERNRMIREAWLKRSL